MANLNTALAPSLDRVEVDTALPFESVRAAVSLFGGQIGAKKATFLERRVTQDAELLHAQQELLRFKELLEIAEREKEKALHELAEAKKALDHADEGVKKATRSNATTKVDSAGSDVQKYGQGLDCAEDKYVVWECTLKFANEKHTAAISEMESAKQQLADLKQELLATSSEKDSILRQTDDALAAIEGSVKGAECFGTELGGVNNWLSILKHASFEVCSKEKAGATKSPKCSLAEVHAGSQGFDMAHGLELKILSMMNDSIRVRQELKCSKDDEDKAVFAVSDVLVVIEAIRGELEERTQKGEIVKKERSVDRASLLSILEVLKMQAEIVKKEVSVLKEREAKAEVKSGTLNAELINLRAELEAAKREAESSVSQLSLALKQANADVARGKTEAEALRKEVSLTRSRTATIEAKTIVSVSQLSQALKQSEADLEEAKIKIAGLLEEASKAAILNATSEAAAMESVLQSSQALSQDEAHLVEETKDVQTSQALKLAEAELEKMMVDMQALQGELSVLQSHSAAEDAKAKESIQQLSQALRKAETELESVKVSKQALQEELYQAQSRNAAEESKAREWLAQLSQALEQADAETALAKAEMKALREELLRYRSKDAKKGDSLMPTHEVGLSQETTQKANETFGIASGALAPMPDALHIETSHLHNITSMQVHATQRRKLQEAGKPLTDLDEALGAKVSKKELRQEMESLKTALKQALHRAEMAESGKLLAEGELKRLREREHRRKERAMAFVTQQNLSKNTHIGNEQSSALPIQPQCELLGNVLNINISAERTKTLVRIGSRKLKKTNTSSNLSSKKA